MKRTYMMPLALFSFFWRKISSGDCIAFKVVTTFSEMFCSCLSIGQKESTVFLSPASPLAALSQSSWPRHTLLFHALLVLPGSRHLGCCCYAQEVTIEPVLSSGATEQKIARHDLFQLLKADIIVNSICF